MIFQHFFKRIQYYFSNNMTVMVFQCTDIKSDLYMRFQSTKGAALLSANNGLANADVYWLTFDLLMSWSGGNLRSCWVMASSLCSLNAWCSTPARSPWQPTTCCSRSAYVHTPGLCSRDCNDLTHNNDCIGNIYFAAVVAFLTDLLSNFPFFPLLLNTTIYELVEIINCMAYHLEKLDLTII